MMFVAAHCDQEGVPRQVLYPKIEAQNAQELQRYHLARCPAWQDPVQTLGTNCVMINTRCINVRSRSILFAPSDNMFQMFSLYTEKKPLRPSDDDDDDDEEDCDNFFPCRNQYGMRDRQ